MTRVLLTGCSTGIGRATAELMAASGYEVVATARRLETLEDLDVAARLRLDVDDDRSVREAVATAGQIDVLVNNAGWELFGPLEELPIDRVRAQFETNVLGPLRLTQALAAGMRERKHGAIVNVSSGMGLFVAPMEGAYAASKHALEALSEVLRFELGHWGIRVVVIEPGEISTSSHLNFETHGADGPYAQLYERLLDGYPNPDAPGPRIVAEAIVAAVESDDPDFRWPVNLNTDYIDARRRMSDREWDRAYRATRKLDW